LEIAGLSGATQGLRFPNLDMLGACVQWLIFDGHGHHFAVVGEGTELWCSEMAVRCLVEAGLLSDGFLPPEPPEPDEKDVGWHWDPDLYQEG